MNTVNLTAEEARRRILDRKEIPPFATINGHLYFTGVTLDNIFNLANVTIKGNFSLLDVTVGGPLHLERVTINGTLNLSYVRIVGGLYLLDLIIEESLYLVGVTIDRFMELSFKRGPTKIYVSPRMAQRVHWAAPNTSLVVIPE